MTIMRRIFLGNQESKPWMLPRWKPKTMWCSRNIWTHERPWKLTMGQLCWGQIKSRVGTRCVGARPMNAHVPLSTLFGAAVQRTLIKCQMYTHVNFSGTWPGRKRAEMPCRPGAHASKGLLFGRILMNYENGIWWSPPPKGGAKKCNMHFWYGQNEGFGNPASTPSKRVKYHM